MLSALYSVMLNGECHWNGGKFGCSGGNGRQWTVCRHSETSMLSPVIYTTGGCIINVRLVILCRQVRVATVPNAG